MQTISSKKETTPIAECIRVSYTSFMARKVGLTLSDLLSHLSYAQARKLLGPRGQALLRKGGSSDIDIDAQVRMDRHSFMLNLGESVATLRLSDAASGRIQFSCTTCTQPCEHVGAALSLILEEKLSLGLAAAPHETVPLEMLSESELIKRALADRAERARTERMSLAPLDGKGFWSDYAVTSGLSGKTYRVALRGWERGESYCSCPDFKTNTLGTCKHLLFALARMKRRLPRGKMPRPYKRKRITLHVRYGEEAELKLLLPDGLPRDAEDLAAPLRDIPINDIPDLMNRIRQLERLGHPVHIYPDAEEMTNALLTRQRLDATVAAVRTDPRTHPLRKELLKVELLPYQLDGVAFAAGAGRALIADDMGLGKTLQGIGTAELLARETGISRVLVICPASVKAQWVMEIERATERTCQIVTGSLRERPARYRSGTFYTIANYEQVLRDFLSIEAVPWDLIILDEGQRIKNWQARTAQVIKSLRSPFALVLTGTPLENRLDELYSVVQFINNRQLGPAFRFFHAHRMADEKGRVLGYRNLDDLRRRLAPILLRRTRDMVLKQLPPRTTEILRIEPSAEQLELHNGHKQTIISILSKRYISEMDLLRLQKALLMCRMAADSTFLLDKEPPGYSTKLEELDSLLERLTAEAGRKILLFSEWTTMLDLIEPFLSKRGAGFVRLDGSVPQVKRQGLVNSFQRDPGCVAFLATNAGATGLNLQAADTVINVDLPWNPAVLEQRIARAHRMGQRRHVHVYLLVTEGTIEEGMLATLSAKADLALAVLDQSSEKTEVALTRNIEELKRKLEVLVGVKPPAPVDQSEKFRVESEAARRQRRESVALAGGELLAAAFAFVRQAMEGGGAAMPGESTQALKSILSECMERAEDGGWKMTVRFRDDAAIEALAGVLAGISARTPGRPNAQ
jgi:superfamily II DNA or RNA helicase